MILIWRMVPNVIARIRITQIQNGLSGMRDGKLHKGNAMANFYVWKRSDGYIGVSAYKPRDYEAMQFEVLKIFTDWSYKCVDFIVSAREVEQNKGKQ
jgi:hypothetical protein